MVDWLTESRLSARAHKIVGLLRGLGDGWPSRAHLRSTRYEAVAWARVIRACRLLSSGRAVITDRLHAHILCLLLDIPHIVLDNNYGKIVRFLDAWTGDFAGVYRASSEDDAEQWAAFAIGGGTRPRRGTERQGR